MMPTEQEIRDNLLDAGCDETETVDIMYCLQSGDRKQAEKLIAACRRKQLDQLHESHLRIDRLDYLSHQLSMS